MRRISLATQFAVASCFIIVLGMTAVGTLIADRIADSVLKNSAGSAALYMDGFIAPHLKDLSNGEPLSPAAIEAIDTLLETQLGERVVGIKIWRSNGYIIYSSKHELTGKTFPPTPRLKSAWTGKIETELDDLHDDENILERHYNVPLVEIYSPIRRPGSGNVIAVAEFYERADALASDISQAKLQSSLAVGGLTLLMAASVFGIVRKGSRTIESQQLALRDRVDELSRLLCQNEDLKVRIVDASRRAAETNESVLRRVGAELHDGPTQLVSLALLRLDGLRELPSNSLSGAAMEDYDQNVNIMKRSLDEALREIRHLCTGLALPELENMSLTEVIELAVRNHERRSGTRVDASLTLCFDCSAPSTLKTTCYRFVQEGLNNAFRHAEGRGQAVQAYCAGADFVIAITDAGNGFDTYGAFGKEGSLGLKGLRDRIESVGGHFSIDSGNGHGTRLIARLPRQVEEAHNHA